MNTYLAKPAEVSRTWHTLDAEGQILGRLATRAAGLLRGKHKVAWTPHVDTGDGVVITNAAKVRVTGLKLKQKVYKRFSGYPAGLKTETLGQLLARKPTEVIRHAVAGMLPHNPLGRQMLRRLKIYPGPRIGDSPLRGQSPSKFPSEAAPAEATHA